MVQSRRALLVAGPELVFENGLLGEVAEFVRRLGVLRTNQRVCGRVVV
jgi:hypothetical protein